MLYTKQGGNANTMLNAIATNDGGNFINYGLANLASFNYLYNTMLLNLSSHSAAYFALQLKTTEGEATYNNMIDALNGTLKYEESYRVAQYNIYSSKRHGVLNENLLLSNNNFIATSENADGSVNRSSESVSNPAPLLSMLTQHLRQLGKKRYELANHLGNVLATITDKRILTEDPNNSDPNNWWWDADVVSAQDYYAFGMLMPDRTNQQNADGYRYAFNGMERDDEWNSNGNAYDFGARIYDSRLGRFYSTDPLEMVFTSWSPYLFAANNPILFIDEFGKGPKPPKNALVESFIKTFSPIVHAAFLASNNTSNRELEKWALGISNDPGAYRKVKGAVGEALVFQHLKDNLEDANHGWISGVQMWFQNRTPDTDFKNPDIVVTFNTAELKAKNKWIKVDLDWEFEHDFNRANGSGYTEEFETDNFQNWALIYEVKTLNPNSDASSIQEFLLEGVNQTESRVEDQSGWFKPKVVGVLVTDYDAYMKAYNDDSNKGKLFRQNIQTFIDNGGKLYLIEGLHETANNASHALKDGIQDVEAID